MVVAFNMQSMSWRRSSTREYIYDIHRGHYSFKENCKGTKVNCKWTKSYEEYKGSRTCHVNYDKAISGDANNQLDFCNHYAYQNSKITFELWEWQVLWTEVNIREGELLPNNISSPKLWHIWTQSPIIPNMLNTGGIYNAQYSLQKSWSVLQHSIFFYAIPEAVLH